MTASRRAWRPLAALAVLASGTALLPTVSAVAAPATPAPAGTATTGTPAPVPVPARYRSQRIAWTPCFDEGELPPGLPAGSERLQCGTFVVPRDWEHPGAGADLTIAVSRLNPAEGRAKRSVLTNPGGPGGPGLSLPLVYLLTERTRLTDNREIVGIDVRGTGASTNVTCTGGTTIGAELDPRDRSRANTSLILDSAALAARFCQTTAAELSPYITTEQTVRDLDLLRHLLGRRTVDWIGYSGGTWLGAAYATYFPARTGRFVLDANTAFTDPWETTFELQPLGFERRWRVDFLPWAARYDERFGLGSTPGQVLRTYEELRAQLAAEPLSLFGIIDVGPTLLDNFVLQSLYSKYAFSDLADTIAVLRLLASGEVTLEQVAAQRPRLVADLRAELQAAEERAAARQPLAADAFAATFFNITCNDTPWTGNRGSLLRESAQQGRRYPLYGWYTLYNPCVFWDRPEAATLAARTGRGAPPVLMVQNDKDPATPIEGARLAREEFRGARMITVLDEGDHTVYPGNPCVDAKVEAFLLGEAPARNAWCRGVGLPEPTPIEGGMSAQGAEQIEGSPLQQARRLSELTGLSD